MSDNEFNPTRKFFESHPQSALIRNLSLAVIQSLHKLLNNPTISSNVYMQQHIDDELVTLGEELEQEGIYHNIHVGKEIEEFRNSPVVAAEFVAGQLLPHTKRKHNSAEIVLPLAHEVSMPLSDNALIIDNNDGLPERLNDFIVMRELVFRTNMMLDGDPLIVINEFE
jgi:hypothetical protein